MTNDEGTVVFGVASDLDGNGTFMVFSKTEQPMIVAGDDTRDNGLFKSAKPTLSTSSKPGGVKARVRVYPIFPL